MEPFVLSLFIMTQRPIEIPTTGPYRDGNGQQIGTATIWRNKMYVRDNNGEILGTFVYEADGTKTLYDPHGKVIEQIKK